jgi:hypothetical protein
MNKLKQFYKDNEKMLLVGTGIVIGSLTTTYFATSVIDGMRLADANLYEMTETGQKFLHVVLENGSEAKYLWQETVA